MSEVTAVEGTSTTTAYDTEPEHKRPRFALPSRRPFDGLGNTLTTAVEIVVVVVIGYVAGQRLGGAIGGGLGIAICAVASFVRVYYKAGQFESPLSRIKEDVKRRDRDDS
jgi:hypothetical protein